MPARLPRATQALLMGALACGPLAAQSQSTTGQFILYRCGLQGLELRNTPCPQEQGASQVLRYDPSSEAAASAARDRSRQEAQLAERLGREREARARDERQTLKQTSPGVLLSPAVTKAASPAATPAPPSAARAAHSKAGPPSHKRHKPALPAHRQRQEVEPGADPVR